MKVRDLNLAHFMMAAPTALASISFEEIEGSKENIQPLKRGRNPKKLLSALQKTEKPLQAKSFFKNKRSEFEEKIKTYKGPDPLIPWLDYIDWVQEYFPTGGHSMKLVELLEACTRKFLKDERYKQDIRYLRVWIGYADRCREPLDIFNFLEHNRIGTQHTLLYEAWSLILESRDKIPDAHEVLSLGMHRKAEPTSRFARIMKGFEVRAAKKITQALQARGNPDSAEDDIGEREAARRPLQGLLSAERGQRRRGLGTRMVRGRSGGLGGGARSSSSSSSSTLSSRSNGGGSAAPSSGQAEEQSTQQSNFQIFCDKGSSAPQTNMTSSSEIKSSKPQWETLGSQKVVDKENTVAISKWSSGPLNAPKDGDAKKKKKTSLRDQIGGASRRRRGRHRHRSRRAVAAANESKIATVSAEKQPITIFQDPGLQPKKIGVREATEGKKTTGGGLHAHATGIDHSGESSSLVSNPLKNFSVEEKGVVEEDKAAGAVAPVHDENSNPNCLN